VDVFGYGSASTRPKITGGVNGNCVTFSGAGDVLDNINLETCGYAGADLIGPSDVVKNSRAGGGNSVGVHADTGSTGAVITNNTLAGNNKLNVNTTSSSSGAFGVLLNGNGATVSGNRITGSIAKSNAYGWDGSAVEIFNGSNNSIHHNTASNDDTLSEWGGTGSGNKVQYNAFSFPAVTGVDVVDGVVLPGTQAGGVVEHNTIYMQASKGKGIVCYSSCSSTTLLKDNVVHASLQSLYTNGPTSNVTGNVLNGGASSPAGIPGNVYGNPNLVNPPTDLHETSMSPSVDLATTAPFSTDLDGNAVPQGNRPDSGAYEFASARG
jgi:hypothetical protein